MSAWIIRCTEGGCGMVTDPGNLAKLLNPANGYLDECWFKCKWCGNRGHIRKSLKTMEGDNLWYLKGAIRPTTGYEKRT